MGEEEGGSVGVRWDSVWGGYTVTTEMDVLASSAGSQLVRARKRVLASVWSGGSLHLCCLGSQLEGGRRCSPPRAPLQHPFSSGLKGDPPTVKAQPHHTAHWETASELLSLSLFPYPQSLFSTSFHPILSLSHHELLVSSP